MGTDNPTLTTSKLLILWLCILLAPMSLLNTIETLSLRLSICCNISHWWIASSFYFPIWDEDHHMWKSEPLDLRTLDPFLPYEVYS